MDDERWAVLHPAVGAGSLGLVLLLSFPSFRQIWTKALLARRIRGAQGDGTFEAVPRLFESADGKATEESIAAFSDRQPRLGASLGLAFGLAASIAAAVLLTLHSWPLSPSNQPLFSLFNIWADVLAWALIGIQCASIPLKEQYDRRFSLSIVAFLSSTALLISAGYRYGNGIFHVLSRADASATEDLATATAVCWLVQIPAALTAALCFASFPHRPDVFHKGGLVDQQHAVSILSRFSFNWNKIVFDIANARKLELEDLPNLDGNTRSACVNERYLSRGGSAGGPRGRLWWQLLMAYKWPLLAQWALTFVRSVLALFPQYVIYQFLEGLDNHKGSSKAANPKLWGWVIGIGVSLVLQIWVGSVQRWLTSSRLEAPLNSLVQSLIFQKALRLDEAADPGHKVSDDDKKDASKGEKTAKKAEGDVRQSVVNHMKLDSGRMMIFCTYNYWFPLAIFKLFLAGSVLAKLLGWKAFLSGFSCALLVYPISHIMSQRYAKIQFGLMKYRDAKAHVLTEALQGMRQIKYSALEQLYEKKILQSRNEELRQFWRVAKWMCSLSLVITTGPILLSSVSFAVYTYTTPTHVRASVIFASLGLFDQLDEAIGYLPLIQVYLIEAWTSCVRIEKFLNQPDKAPVAEAGDAIVFENATVSWPRIHDLNGPASGEAATLASAAGSLADTAEADGTVTPDVSRSVLRDINVAFPPGKLSLITGKTGAGKSLLLAAILGEVKLLSGNVKVPQAPAISVIESENVNDSNWVLPTLTAFVSQTPWVESGTLQNNILFGMPFRKTRYQKVLQACALAKDIELLADGDMTEVGPKGVTLSGGQRWRVALARALYSRAGILILDDVLSAVDTHVGRIMVNEALSGDLAKGRTIILATHHPEMCLAHASYLVRLDSGRVEGVERLERTASDQVLLEPEASMEGTNGTVAEETADEASGSADAGQTSINKAAGDKKADGEERESGRVQTRVYREYIGASKSLLLWVLIFGLLIAGRLLGVASTWSLKELSGSYDKTVNASLAIHSFFTQSSELDWDWQSHRTPKLPQPPTVSLLKASGDDSAYQKNVIFWITAYIVLDCSSLLVGTGQQLLIMFTGLRASRVLFERMTHSILRAPLSWVDKTPTGRILNRFTSDTFTVDRRLASNLSSFLRSAIGLVVIIAASVSVSPFIVIFGFGLLILYARIANVYIAAAREAKRINSVAHSPVYDQFSSVLTGLSTIRAFHRTEFYVDRVFGLIDNSAKASWALQLLARWMNFRMGMFGAIFVTAVASCIVFGNIEASMAGFGLVFALRYTSSLSQLLANVTSIELGFNAAERILEYIDIDTEPEGGRDVPAAWPTKGHIEVENLTVSYGPDLSPVLKELNFEVQPGERIGVVGRTGAGKSTLAAVFFRLLEAQEGSIRIDNIDISTLQLHQLRSRLAIIPQDPFLFSGTLRSNLDLEDAIDDYDLHHVLKRVHLVDPNADAASSSPENSDGIVSDPVASASLVEDHTEEEVAQLLDSSSQESAPEEDAANPADAAVIVSDSATEVGSREADVESGGNDVSIRDGDSVTKNSNDDQANSFTNLAMPISTGGGNLSQGQRQLVCLARALLTRPKIVVLDEATSAVDRGTDSAIQESLRREFAAGGCTVLVIAHRLSTVVDFDRLLVLKEGRVAEMGTPRELMERGIALDAQRSRGEVAEGAAAKESDGAGAFWELAKKSAEKDKLLEMVFGDNIPTF